ncbi:MAG TPA: hypothetical protein VGH32_08735 [Pirellulales bacterium]
MNAPSKTAQPPAASSVAGHELVGHRLVGGMTAPPLVRLWGRATSRIVKYGFAIEYRDLEPPRTGIFDGLRIVIDPDVDFEMQCFVLLHLFGHSVQWTAPALAEKTALLQKTTHRAAFMGVLRAYEFEAAQFGMQLMHEAEIDDLDQWFSDFAATDWKYVERFYQTGAIQPWQECIATDQPLVPALPIPELRHRHVEVRYAF